MAKYTSVEKEDPYKGLPPLPPMYGAELFCGGDAYSYARGQLPKNYGGTPLYTATQMYEYALEALKNERTI